MNMKALKSTNLCYMQKHLKLAQSTTRKSIKKPNIKKLPKSIKRYIMSMKIQFSTTRSIANTQQSCIQPNNSQKLWLRPKLLLRKSISQLHWNLHLCLHRSMKCLKSRKTTKNLLFSKRLLKKQLLSLKSQSLRMKLLDLLSNPLLKRNISPNITSKLLRMLSMKRSQSKLKIMSKLIPSSNRKK